MKKLALILGIALLANGLLLSTPEQEMAAYEGGPEPKLSISDLAAYEGGPEPKLAPSELAAIEAGPPPKLVPSEVAVYEGGPPPILSTKSNVEA